MSRLSSSQYGVAKVLCNGKAAKGALCAAIVSHLAACSAPTEELAVATEAAALVDCGTANAPLRVGSIGVSEISEASGLVRSTRNPSVLYTHNDSGGLSRVYALSETGVHLATLNLQGCAASDWEDIAIGPGPTAGTSYIYVGDIGDNALRRQDVVVERVTEPSIAATDRGRSLQLGHDSLVFRYPDGAHNAETLLVDPSTADLYILTKGDRDGSRLYVAYAPHSATVATTLHYLTTLNFGSGALSGSTLATGGDFRHDGAAVLVRTYNSVFLWQRAPGTNLVDTFASQPCKLASPGESQGEAIAFSGDGTRFFTLGEGSKQPLYQVSLD